MRIDRVDTDELARTWQEAFADYVVDMSQMTDERIRMRCAKNAVDYDVSPGAFDGEACVGEVV